jgi:hypothetical protein
MLPVSLPRSTTISALSSRYDEIARRVRSCEAEVARLRSELRVPHITPGGVLRTERAMVSAVRDLADARARLAQVSRELRRVR